MATGKLAHRGTAAEQLHQLRPDIDANEVVASLCDGLDLLADLLFTRIDRDVEQNFNLDSMLMPASTSGEVEASSRVRKQIDIYSVVVAAEEAASAGYIKADAESIIGWFSSLRLSEHDGSAVGRRIEKYRALEPQEQPRQFASTLERRMPHATNAPLVIYRLYPLAVGIVVAIAFGDHLRAGELRNRQAALLPVISDCHPCHGRPLDNGEECPACGNPLWQYDWLCVAD